MKVMHWPGFPDASGIAVHELPFQVVLSGGLPDRYRLPFVAFIAVASLGGLALLAYKLRTADPETVGDREISSKLERTDLLEGGDPANTLEWIIKTANRPVAYAVLLTTLFGLAVLGLATDRFAVIAVMLLFGGVLFSIQAFLRFGWPHFEAFYDRRQPDERDPHSFRFQGFSTDVMIFLTLLAILFVGTLILVALEALFW